MWEIFTLCLWLLEIGGVLAPLAFEVIFLWSRPLLRDLSIHKSPTIWKIRIND